VLLVIAACGGGAPFLEYDPPPTFAYKYTASNPYLAYQYPAGSVLVWQHLADAIHPTFTPLGDVYSSTEVSAFGAWVIIDYARWPALWRVTSVAGCGTGSAEELQIAQKLVTSLACVEGAGGDGYMDPEQYWANEVPDYLTFSFEPSEIPGGTWANIYIVDAYGEVVDDSGAQVDSSGTAVIDAPALDPGDYYVLVEFEGIEYDGVQLDLVVLDPYINPIAALGPADPDHRRIATRGLRVINRPPVGREAGLTK
jgi:hypothetical protein